MNQEVAFKLVFTIAAIVFCLVIVGFFLLAVKIILLFAPEVRMFGLVIQSAAITAGSFR